MNAAARPVPGDARSAAPDSSQGLGSPRVSASHPDSWLFPPNLNSGLQGSSPSVRPPESQSSIVPPPCAGRRRAELASLTSLSPACRPRANPGQHPRAHGGVETELPERNPEGRVRPGYGPPVHKGSLGARDTLAVWERVVFQGPWCP